MCYNISYIEKQLDKYAKRYSNVLPPKWKINNIINELPVFYFVSGFSHPELPVIKHDGTSLFEWGLIPHWTKNAQYANEIKSKTLNAIGETVFEKPSFKSSIKSKRCLLGINGFFEWHTYNNKKYPFFIKSINNEMFSLGCIYDSWTDKNTGEVKNTFSIITTPANDLLGKIHNVKKRMPLIICKDDEPKWIDDKLNEKQINKLIKPNSELNLNAYPVSRFLNYSKNDRNTIKAVEKIEYPELKNFA